MTTQNTKTVSKLVSRFDNELKKLILQDLKAINRTKNQVLDKITNSVAVNRLSVA
ncbi:hypothetical protein [Mucilaginibacter ginkgonis]|uniref:Uncharacterized protein n=1 Tax=Mucilaginibacter ginkgonis TaxID=2682091 RepID=A0A6I4I0P9_9SPHI|nr:hypothetical protein [Mucilaginibacter ginkgonis]QQL48331.1 hypothetical protein GO620_008995 [Mucilaginibacter ginkgonis]